MNAPAHIVYSNMPYEEELRLNRGQLCVQSCEELVDFHSKMGDAQEQLLNCESEIQEARPGIEEDFFDGLLDSLNDLHKSTRSASTKAALAEIIETVTNMQTELVQSLEYSEEKTTSALRILKNLTQHFE